MSKRSTQGEFLAELASRQPKAAPSHRFTWETQVTRAQRAAEPEAKLETAPTAREARLKPAAPLPRTAQGALDIAELRSDLAAEIRGARSARRHR